jgi:hypothetical protein
MDMEHGHEAWTCSIGMQNGHAKSTCMMCKQHGKIAWTCSTNMKHGQAACRYEHVALPWIRLMDIQHEQGHLARTRTWACSIDRYMQLGHKLAAWTWNAERPWTCSTDTDMTHWHGHAAWTAKIGFYVSKRVPSPDW